MIISLVSVAPQWWWWESSEHFEVQTSRLSGYIYVGVQILNHSI